MLYMIDTLLRQVPEFKGKKRLLSFMYSSKRRNARDLIIRGKYNCIYKLPNIIENVGFDIFANGIYENDTIDFVVDKCKNATYFIDIGANIGSITIPVCKRLKDLKVICIEASPKVFEYLEWNINENKLVNVTMVNKAMAETDDEHVNFYSPDEKYGKGSMARVFEKKGQLVHTITLTKLIADHHVVDIGLIKVDVEGFEHLVFKGGSDILKMPNAPDILFEFIDWAENLANAEAGDAQQLLLSYGYSLFLINRQEVASQLTESLKKGAAMIWATKKE